MAVVRGLMDGISDVALDGLRCRLDAVAPAHADVLAALVVDVASYHNLSLDAAERSVFDQLTLSSPDAVLASNVDAVGNFGRF